MANANEIGILFPFLIKTEDILVFATIDNSRPKALYHVTPKSKLHLILRDGLVPNDADCDRPLPRASLFTSKEACIEALDTWLGARYDDNWGDQLAIVEVAPDLRINCQFGEEAIIKEAIPANKLIRCYATDWSLLSVNCG